MLEKSKKKIIQRRSVSPQARQVSIGMRKRVMVLPFLDVRDVNKKNLTAKAQKSFVNRLKASGYFVVIDSQLLPNGPQSYMNDKKEYDFDRLAPVAEKMGVTALIEAKILKITARRKGDSVGLIRKLKAEVESRVQLKVVNAKSGRVIHESVREGRVDTTVTRVAKTSLSDRFLQGDPNLVKEAVNAAFKNGIIPIIQSVDKISWEGRVAAMEGERIFINAGRLSGLQVGDILKVTEPGSEIYDPDTGAYIGKAPGRMKGTVEVMSYFGKDGAIASVHSGSGFEKNDKVELY